MTNPWCLTDRELEVLSLLYELDQNRFIALRLGIGLRTIENHFVNIFRKMNVTSRVRAAVDHDRWIRAQGMLA